MNTKVKSRLPLSELADLSNNKPLSTAVVAELLDAKIILGGCHLADTAFTETLLQISGFTHIYTATDGEGVLRLLREGIHNERCDVDLLIVDDGSSRL